MKHMWTIHLITNSVKVTEKCAKDLLKAGKHDPFEDLDDVLKYGSKDKLFFNSDHYEHMDWLHEKKLQNVLKKHKVEGDITFADFEGDACGSMWGYRFDGKGGMTTLTGNIVWFEDK